MVNLTYISEIKCSLKLNFTRKKNVNHKFYRKQTKTYTRAGLIFNEIKKRIATQHQNEKYPRRNKSS